MINVLEHIGIL